MNYYLIAIVAALVIVLPLAFYAGKLLFQLRQQTQQQNAIRNSRIETITQSVQTIAMAVSQQQCNLSEGAIRLVNLLESIPITPAIVCERDYPALFELYTHVKDLPTHAKRKAMDSAARDQQDKVREEHESSLESAILKEVLALSQFQPSP